MASITIRNLDAAVKERLRQRAARHGRSMEEEARLILAGAVSQGDGKTFLATLRRTLRDALAVDLPESDRRDRELSDLD